MHPHRSHWAASVPEGTGTDTQGLLGSHPNSSQGAEPLGVWKQFNVLLRTEKRISGLNLEKLTLRNELQSRCPHRSHRAASVPEGTGTDTRGLLGSHPNSSKGVEPLGVWKQFNVLLRTEKGNFGGRIWKG